MTKKAHLFLFITFILFSQLILHAETNKRINADILAQEGDIIVTRQDALFMLEDMTWKQKQRILGDEERFKSLILSFLVLKKQEQEAINRNLHSRALTLWKAKKNNAQLLSRELTQEFKDKLLIPKSINDLAKDNYHAHPEKYIIEEKISVSHILLTTNKDDTKETQRRILGKMKTIIKEINAGLTFEEAAKKYSQDKGSASKGGVINYFKHGQMVPAFEKSAFSLKNIGDISEPVKTQFGYHIIKLIGRIEASTIPFESAKNKLISTEKSLYTKKKTDEFLKTFQVNKNTNVFLSALREVINDERNKLITPLQ